MKTATAIALAALTGASALLAQETFPTEYISGLADVREKHKGQLVVTDDTIFFRTSDVTTSFAIPMRSVDSVFAAYGEERTAGAAAVGYLVWGVSGALLARNAAEFLCIRVETGAPTASLSLDSTRTVIVKTKTHMAVVIGNAIWSRMHPPPPGRQPSDGGR
jgi:hypothetical protein